MAIKQVVNFRLSNHTVNILSILEKELHSSKTAVVENALEFYAKKKLSVQHPLLAYAGILDKEEATSMLAITKSSKHNKNIRAKL